MASSVETIMLRPEGRIPNSTLPVLYYRGGLPVELRLASQCQALFAENNWVGNWVDGLYNCWHFHVTGHEVLGCVAGEAVVGLGGETGQRFVVEAGDVLVLPAGTGHRSFSTSDRFSIVGGYPPGQDGTITRPEEIEPDEAAKRIAALDLPLSDPLLGTDGPLVQAWRLR